MVIGVARNFLTNLSQRGVRETYYYALERRSEKRHEKELGVETASLPIELEEFGFSDREFNHYFPIPHAALLKTMNRLSLTDKDVFIDFGCGMGRVVVRAATYPLRRVLGVDIVKPFVESTKLNMQRSNSLHKCHDFEIIEADVRHYDIPDDTSIFHFFDPFTGEALDRVIDNIDLSLTRAPRKAVILFANPVDFERAIKNRPWISLREEIPYPHANGNSPATDIYKIYDLSVPPEAM